MTVGRKLHRVSVMVAVSVGLSWATTGQGFQAPPALAADAAPAGDRWVGTYTLTGARLETYAVDGFYRQCTVTGTQTWHTNGNAVVFPDWPGMFDIPTAGTFAVREECYESNGICSATGVATASGSFEADSRVFDAADPYQWLPEGQRLHVLLPEFYTDDVEHWWSNDECGPGLPLGMSTHDIGAVEAYLPGDLGTSTLEGSIVVVDIDDTYDDGTVHSTARHQVTLEYSLQDLPRRAGVILETDPAGHETVTLALAGDIAGVLEGDGMRLDASPADGIATVTASAAPGWVITGVLCDIGSSGSVDPGGTSATLVVLALADPGGTCTVTVSDIAQRYAPLVYLHPDETHRPMSADMFLDHSDLSWSANLCPDEHFDVWTPADLGSGTISWGPGACGPGGPERWYSTTDYTRPGDARCTTDLVTWGHRCKDPDLDETEGFVLDLVNEYRTGAPSSDVTSGGVPAYFEFAPGESLTYWFLYGNSIPNSGKAGAWVISHEGDWEHIVVHLDAGNNPTSVTWYYHHWNSDSVPTAPKTWDDVDKIEGTHPIVYSALEGHGSYWLEDCDFDQPGATDFVTRTSDDCGQGDEWATWENVLPAHDEPWYGFGGAWGQVGALSEAPVLGGNTTGPPGPGSPAVGCVSCRYRYYEPDLTTRAARAGGTYLLQLAGWRPNQTVWFTIFSEPRALGSAVADDAGHVSVELQIPGDLPAGEHELQTMGNVAPGWDRVVRSPITISAALPPIGPPTTIAPRLTPLVPARVLESRSGSSSRTVDGLFEGIGVRGAGTVTELKVTGRGGVPVNAAAVLLNVTAVRPDAAGFLTVFPCGSARPNASNVNYRAGDVVPNAVLAKVGAGGRVCIYTDATTHVIVDVNGYVPSGGAPESLVPARVLESRSGSSSRTVDGLFEGIGVRGAGTVTELKVTGRGGVPVNAAAVLLNVTAVRPDAAGFLTVFPCGSARPNASNVNYRAGDVVPNAVLAKVGAGGRVCIYTDATTHVIVDVNGYVT